MGAESFHIFSGHSLFLVDTCYNSKTYMLGLLNAAMPLPRSVRLQFGHAGSDDGLHRINGSLYEWCDRFTVQTFQTRFKIFIGVHYKRMIVMKLAND